MSAELRGVRLPEGFERVDGSTTTVWTRSEARPWVEQSLSTHGSLYLAAAAGRGVGAHRGRGPVHEVRVGGVTWLVRRGWRGGGMRWLGDRHVRVGPPRVFSEVLVSERLRALGVSTPRVVAAAVYAAGPFRRTDLMSEAVPEARSLDTVLLHDPGPDPGDPGMETERQRAVDAVLALIGDLAAIGLEHPDLNARNVLLTGPHDRPKPWVVDLDGCRLVPGASQDTAAVARRSGALTDRLVRSLLKLAAGSGAATSARVRQAVLMLEAGPPELRP